MRKLVGLHLSVVFLVVCWSCTIAFAQSDERPTGVRPPYGDAHVGGDVPVDEQMAEARAARRPPQSEDRVVKRGLLALSKDDRNSFAAFLRMRNTGLIRLFALESPSYPPKKRTFERFPVCGACYSFANITHFSGSGSDVVLSHGNLSVGFGWLGYGLLTNLGDVPLEEVSLSDPRTRFIANYRPAETFLEAREENLRFRAVVTLDGNRYQDSLPVEVNTTYLLRSINYAKRVFASNASADPVRNARRTDVLVALRVVRQDADGSVTIAWKLLKKYSAPKIEWEVLPSGSLIQPPHPN